MVRRLPRQFILVRLKNGKCWTILKISDNSGGLFGSCIRVLKIADRIGAIPGQIVTMLLKKIFIKNCY
jgi:ribosomal protein L14